MSSTDKMTSGGDEYQAALERIREHLPAGDDLSLLVLKGHLLVEESLLNLIEKKVEHPKAITAGKFGFWQIAHIAEALWWTEDRAWIFDAARKLNTVRNEFAHGLDAKKAPVKIGKFLAVAGDEEGSGAANVAARLRLRIGTLVFAMEGIRNPITYTQEPGSTLLTVGMKDQTRRKL